MRNPSLKVFARYETKILPISQPSYQTLWQTSVVTSHQSQRNSLIGTITNIFDSASARGKSKACKPSQIFVQKMECSQSGPANLASCKKPRRSPATFFESEVPN